jgi:hypothetical protein
MVVADLHLMTVTDLDGGRLVQAMHLQLHQPVAMKFLLPEVLGNQQVVQRFLREVQAAVRLKSEHVVRVIDVGMLETVPAAAPDPTGKPTAAPAQPSPQSVVVAPASPPPPAATASAPVAALLPNSVVTAPSPSPAPREAQERRALTPVTANPTSAPVMRLSLASAWPGVIPALSVKLMRPVLRQRL